MKKFIKTSIKEYLKESSSTDSKELYNSLNDSPIIKYIDRPCGRFLQSIDLKVIDVNNINELIKILDINNWYIERISGNTITITQKYIDEAKVDIPGELYHTTPTKNVENILKHGLNPKSEDLRHKYPPRIYVSNNRETLDSLSKELKRFKGDEEYTILEIDTKGLNMNLFIDTTSAYRGHYYIQDIDNIPPKNIKVV